MKSGKQFLFVLHTICISPHQLPLMKNMVKELGKENCLYIYREKLEKERLNSGWITEDYPWIICENDQEHDVDDILKKCKLLMSGIRDFDLFDYRNKNKLVTIYSSERWYKPIKLPFFNKVYMSGFIRIIFPYYFLLALKIRRLLLSSENFYYFPISVNAANDIAKLYFHFSDLICENCAGGRLIINDKNRLRSNDRYKWLRKMYIWGYFVEKSRKERSELVRTRMMRDRKIFSCGQSIRILWIGRLLPLKNVDVIIEAVRILKKKYDFNICVSIYGEGECKKKLVSQAKGLPISFHSFVPISQVRDIMENHDLYVFPSNSYDGWGAVVSEALEENMKVIASYQSGVGSTVLPKICTFDGNNAQELAERILNYQIIPYIKSDKWGACAAAHFLIKEFLL